jgi:hypothetical protein
MRRRAMQVTYKRFLTIAVRQGPDLDENHATLTKGWRSISQWLRRNYSLKAYTWTIEESHSHRNIHMHIVLDCDHIAGRALRRAAERAGLTASVKIKKVFDQSGLLTYMMKSCTKIKLPRYKRRFQTSVRARPVQHRGVFYKNEEFAAASFLDTHFYRITASPDLPSLNASTLAARTSPTLCACGGLLVPADYLPMVTDAGELYYLASCRHCYDKAGQLNSTLSVDERYPYVLRLPDDVRLHDRLSFDPIPDPCAPLVEGLLLKTDVHYAQ